MDKEKNAEKNSLHFYVFKWNLFQIIVVKIQTKKRLNKKELQPLSASVYKEMQQ